MRESNKIFFATIIIMGLVVILTTAGSISFLYHTAVDEQKERLIEVVKNQAKYIHIFHEANSVHGSDMDLETHRSHGNELQTFFNHLNESSSADQKQSKRLVLNFYVAEKLGDHVRYYTGTPQMTAHPVPYPTLRGKPMGLALNGKTDVLETTDHLGNKIICSFTFVQSVGVGIVAKIFLKDIRRPFIKTAIITYTGALLLLLLSSFFIKLTVSPLAARLEKQRHELKKINKNLHKLATTDSLTALYNRQHFNQQLNNTIHISKRHNQKISLILFDIDNFKKINDDLGHPSGDAVLKELSVLIKGSLRKIDVLARWGGEEFIILTIGNNERDVHFLAQKLCEIIAQHHFTINQQVTCSFGCTMYCNGEDIDDFIGRADDALYEAKNRGRNQVVSK